MKIQGYPVDTGATSSVSYQGAQGSFTQTQSVASDKGSVQLSPMMQMAYSRQITDLRYTSDETYFGYRKSDNSMALKVHSTTDVSLQQEDISIDVTFSAEALGLTAEHFKANGGKPYEFSLFFQQTDLQMNSTLIAKEVTPKRTVEDILSDLGQALSKALSKKGGKNVFVELDDDALRTLLADAKVANVLTEILQLISLINSMKMNEENSENEIISISGKGKSYIDVEQNTKLEGKQTNISFKFTINPPAEELESGVTDAAAADLSDSVEPAVDLSV